MVDWCGFVPLYFSLARASLLDTHWRSSLVCHLDASSTGGTARGLLSCKVNEPRELLAKKRGTDPVGRRHARTSNKDRRSKWSKPPLFRNTDGSLQTLNFSPLCLAEASKA